MTNTLVLGGTGKTGRRILARLRLNGIPVRPVSRNSSVRFDWSDPGTWDAALKDVAVAYLIAPPEPGPTHDFAARAEAAGVQHLVLLSGRGADTWGDAAFGRNLVSAEDAVRTSSIPWTVVRASNFHQNFSEDVFHAPLVAGELVLPADQVPEPFIDIEDVADVAAAALISPSEHAGQTYELTGPRSITFGEAVGMISRASGRPMTFRTVPPQEYTESLLKDGVPEAVAQEVTEMFVLMERGVIASSTDGVARVLGRSPRSFEDYVVRAAAAGTWEG